MHDVIFFAIFFYMAFVPKALSTNIDSRDINIQINFNQTFVNSKTCAQKMLQVLWLQDLVQYTIPI